jgi:hypothetical protein
VGSNNQSKKYIVKCIEYAEWPHFVYTVPVDSVLCYLESQSLEYHLTNNRSHTHTH